MVHLVGGRPGRGNRARAHRPGHRALLPRRHEPQPLARRDRTRPRRSSSTSSSATAAASASTASSARARRCTSCCRWRFHKSVMRRRLGRKRRDKAQTIARRGRPRACRPADRGISTAKGYDIARTADGDEALMLAEERTPDLVILDWMIEGVSGIEVCRRLRRRSFDRACADHHAHRARRGGRPNPRARDGRRRLCDEAVQPARAPGARRGGAPAGSAGAGRRATRLCRYRNGRRLRIVSAAEASRCSSARPSSDCSGTSWNIPAACFRASGCSTRSGRTIRTSTRAPSTCTSAACANRSTRAVIPT